MRLLLGTILGALAYRLSASGLLRSLLERVWQRGRGGAPAFRFASGDRVRLRSGRGSRAAGAEGVVLASHGDPVTGYMVEFRDAAGAVTGVETVDADGLEGLP